MLESTRKDVKKLLKNFESDDDDAEYFSTKNAEIKISYTTGECADEDNDERWNVAEGKVKFIKISLEKPIKLEKIEFDYSIFQKETKFDIEDQFIYRNKTSGIAFEVDENKVETIFLFPPLNSYPLVCNNKIGKEFYTSESWSDDSELRNSNIPVCTNHPPKVDELILSATEIIIACDRKSCFDSNRREISIITAASDPENDPLVYNYAISGGKIVGKGAKVVWDLSGVSPGTYTITAGVDDGCGICGETKTQSVVIK